MSEVVPLVLPGFEPKERPRRDRMSLAVAVAEVAASLNPDDYANINQDIIQFASPRRIRPHLLPEQSGRFQAGVVDYDPTTDPAVTGGDIRRAALSPKLYTNILRSVSAYTSSVEATLEANSQKKAERTDTAIDEEELSLKTLLRVEKGLVGRMAVMEATTDEVLKYLETSRFLNRHAAWPFFQWRPGSQMLEHVATAQKGIDSMLDAVKKQKRWTAQQSDLARRTVEFMLFLDTPGHRNLRRWYQYTAMNVDYWKVVKNLYANRTAGAVAELADYRGRIIKLSEPHATDEPTLF